MSTLIVTNVKNTSSATNNIVTNDDGSATIAGASITLATAQTASWFDNLSALDTLPQMPYNI
jgi:hypothetical protein